MEKGMNFMDLRVALMNPFPFPEPLNAEIAPVTRFFADFAFDAKDLPALTAFCPFFTIFLPAMYPFMVLLASEPLRNPLRLAMLNFV